MGVSMSEIYLDNAATTKPKAEVVISMLPYLIWKWQNPSSLYSPSTEIKKEVEKARETVGKFIGASSKEIYFTSCGSESNCWAIQGFVNWCLRHDKRPVVITSTIEHKSIVECVGDLQTTAYFVNVDSSGFINMDELQTVLKECSKMKYNKILVSIQYANNEIGTIQKAKEIADLTHKYGGVFHTDAVQAFGHIPIDVELEHIDMLSASGHKIGTPKGVGFLYKKTVIDINPIIYGTQMDGLRGGTENVPYIIGMAKAVELLGSTRDLIIRNSHIDILRDYMIDRFQSGFGCKLNGAISSRLPNNINVTFPSGVTGESILYTLSLSNIFISTSSACNSHSVVPSHVLKEIGLTDEEAMRSIRISLPENISRENIDYFISELDKTIKIITL